MYQPNLPASSDNGTAPFVGQPCLVLGVGGMGHRIALNLEAQLFATYGRVPAGIRILVFDIDEENLSVRADRRIVALERESSLFCLGPVPVARIKANLDKLPTIQERLPSLEHIPPIAAAQAARQQRPIGQLSFQWRFPLLREQVHDALWHLAGRDHRGDESYAVDPSRGLKIIQVGSICGGTNSGMFIDLGYLVRHELEGLGTLGDACTVVGIGVLPGVFRNVNGPNLVANSVAALLELEAVTMNGHQPLIYRDGTTISTGRPPFNMYLLVDAVDEGGRVWFSHDDLCRMVARAIFVMAASRLGEQSEGELDNLDDVLTQRTPDGHGTFFGSLGLSVLEFPANRIFHLFTARHGLSVVANGLLRPADDEAARATLRGGLQALVASTPALQATLARDEAGLPLAVAVEAPASLRRLPDAQVPQEAIQFVQAYGRLRLDADYRAAVRQQARLLVDQAMQRIEADLRAMVNDPRLGLADSQAFLQASLQHLEALQAALGVQRKANKNRQVQAEQGMDHATQELIQAPEAPWPFRRNRISGALDRFLQAAQEALALRLEEMIVEQAVALVAQIASRAQELARGLVILEGRLQAVAAHLEEEVAARSRHLELRQGHPALAMVDGPYLEELYHNLAPDRRRTVHRLVAGAGSQGLFAWLDLDPAGLAKSVMDACREPFEVILSMTIDEALAARGQFSPQARLAALLDEARPAWNLDETRLPGGGSGLRRITVVGVPDHTRSIFRGDGSQVVSIHDPHKVLALSLTIGAPYTALQAWPGYLAEYERVRRLRPLHTLPAFQREGQEARLALALGLIFGQIFTRGVYFYYRPADELANEERLGQGALKAIQSLGAQDGLVRDLLERVEAHIEHIGLGQALEALTAYCQPAAGDDELTRELKLAVRDYASTLQANARLAGQRS